MAKSLTPEQLSGLNVTERVASSFSLLGTAFIFFTFSYSPAFRKPINRLIFYASWGNALCNIATLMAQAPIHAGKDSHICQFQGFLLQMFLPADALWNLAMAINVYLTLFRKYNAQNLKSLEWRYHIMCYGLPFIVAFTCSFVSTKSNGNIYGPATLWCSINTTWSALRIAIVYAPAWCCILIAFAIYALAGVEIFAKRQQLRAFSQHSDHIGPVENPFTDFRTTEIHISSELADMQSPDFGKNTGFTPTRDGITRPPLSQSPSDNKNSYAPYSVTIDSTPKSPRVEVGPTSRIIPAQRKHKAAMEANTAAFGYTKVASLFFLSLLVTWVPSSVNRVYSLIHPDKVSVGLVFATGIVLPLMGFWNSVIYITTSRRAVSSLFKGKLAEESALRTLPLLRRRPSLAKRRRTGSASESVKALSPVGRKGYDQV